MKTKNIILNLLVLVIAMFYSLLIVNATAPTQDPTGAKNPIHFSSTSYWLNGNYRPAGNSMYKYVYDSNSLIYPHVEAYRNSLEGIGVNIVDAKLMSYEQAVALGCIEGRDCLAAPKWVRSTTYWLGSVSTPITTSGVSVERIKFIFDNGQFTESKYQNEYVTQGLHIGIRPLITISASDLG